VSVLVLNWNGQSILCSCLESILQDACPHIEILVVDNGSTDDSVSLVKEHFPQVRVILNGANLGFSRGYNAAVPHARGKFLVFLNNDIVVKQGWLEPIVDTFLENPKIGITSCKMLFYGTNIINNIGGYLKLCTGAGELGFGESENSIKLNKIIEPFYASGAALAIRREIFELLGGFDSKMFAYGEDLDLCWRARLAGFKIRCVPESVVYHRLSASWGLLNPRKVRLVTAHQIRSMIKCLSRINLLFSLPLFLFFALIKGIFLSLAEKNSSYLYSIILACVDNIRDRKELRGKRAATQRLRVVSDHIVLRSEDFGFFEDPRKFWKIFKFLRRWSKKDNTALP